MLAVKPEKSRRMNTCAPPLNAGKYRDVYQRDYVWDYQNRLIKTQDPLHTVQYRYGADGQRAVKYSEGTPNETLYFNNMWQMGASAADSRWLQSKHIFVGETRIATKNGYGERNSGYETEHQYWYHGIRFPPISRRAVSPHRTHA